MRTTVGIVLLAITLSGVAVMALLRFVLDVWVYHCIATITLGGVAVMALLRG